MLRHRSHPLVALSLVFGGFAACTFGADDFEIVPDDAAGGSGASSSSGASNSMGGNDDVGGADSGPTAGTDSVAGAGLGGEPAAGGTGGSINLPQFVCSPLGEVLDVFTPIDLENNQIQGEPTVVSMGEAVVVAVATNVGGIAESRLYYRALSDSDSGTVDPLDAYTISSGRWQIAAGVADGSDVKLMSVADTGLFELAITTANGGRDFTNAVIGNLSTPDACESASGTVDGYVRDAAGSHQRGEWSYAITCGAQATQQGQPELYSLYLVSDGGGFAPEEIAPPEAMAIDNIVRQYVRVGGTHVMLVGAEVGPTVGVRTGSTLDELQTVYEMGLSQDANVWSSFMMRGLPSGVFLHGAAFTTDEPNPPPLVPAEIYDGSVDITEVASLFKGAGQDVNVPPSPLQLTATFTKASELIGMDDAIPIGENVLLAGASVSPRDAVNVALVTQAGEVLAPPTAIYTAEAGTTIDDHSLRVARLGIGFVAVWIENGTVKARLISCLQD